MATQAQLKTGATVTFTLRGNKFIAKVAYIQGNRVIVSTVSPSNSFTITLPFGKVKVIG